MRLLLDAHVFLWFIWDDPRLSDRAADLIEDTSNERWISAASAWEIAIKVSIGKLKLAKPVEELLSEQFEANAISLLPVSLKHLGLVETLPLHHKDPFDRLIVSQSLVEQMPLISADPLLDRYGVQRLW